MIGFFGEDDALYQTRLFSDMPLTHHTCEACKIAFSERLFLHSASRGGDILLAANGYSMENVTHNHAVAMLKSIKGRVTLKIVSWPGTLV